MYYSIVRQKYVLEYLQNSLKYYRERLTITEERWKVGGGSKLDYLQSQNDLNSQQAAIQNGELALSNMKVNMNLMLNRAADTTFETEDIQNDLTPYQYEEMLQKAVVNDETLQLMDKAIELNKLTVKDWEGSRMPGGIYHRCRIQLQPDQCRSDPQQPDPGHQWRPYRHLEFV